MRARQSVEIEGELWSCWNFVRFNFPAAEAGRGRSAELVDGGFLIRGNELKTDARISRKRKG